MPSNVSVLSSDVQLDVNSPLHWFFGGPDSILLYQLIQGAFTVLSLKELWSIASILVKGRSNSLNINRTITWNMVEQFEDLRKTILKICIPCLKDLLRLARGKTTLISRRGWRRVLGSFIIAALLFGFDIALIVAQAPSMKEIDASSMQLVTWSNDGYITPLDSTNVLQGSFSRSIILESRSKDVELSRQLSFALERTDMRDFSGAFNVELPAYNGTFFEIDRSEEWRILARIYCSQRLYQYKLRLDLSTAGTRSSWFVPTWNFFNESTPNTRAMSEYQEAMRDQLGIDSAVVWSNKTYAMLQTRNTSAQPPERTNLTDGNSVLTHDAIASLFLSTVRISVANKSAVLFERKYGERKVQTMTVRGGVAQSQRPYVPLWGSFFIYVFFAGLSAILQWNARVGEVAKELNAVLELRCKRKDAMIGVLNVEGAPLEKVESQLVRPARLHTKEKFFDVVPLEGSDLVKLKHNGFLPAKLLVEIHRFMEEKEDLTDDARECFYAEWGIIEPELQPNDTNV